MFAYCPGITQKRCGISDESTSENMLLTATQESQKISIDTLKYQNDGSFSDKAYDFCYYEIKSTLTEEEASALKGDAESVSIQLKISKAKEMNVYIYGGDKSEALIPITDDNNKAETEKTYAVDYKEGMLIVAYPNEKAESEFEFSYSVGAYTEETEDGMLFVIIGAVVLLMVILTIGICVMKKKQSNSKNRVEIIDEENKGTQPNQAQGGNETSVQLEEGEHPENLNIGSKGKGEGGDIAGGLDSEVVVDGKRYSKVKNQAQNYDTKDPFNNN